MQSEAARALGGMRSEIARDALLACVSVKHPKARRGVVGALGQFRDDDAVAAALEGILRKGDASYYVEADGGAVARPDAHARRRSMCCRRSR